MLDRVHVLHGACELTQLDRLANEPVE